MSPSLSLDAPRGVPPPRRGVDRLRPRRRGVSEGPPPELPRLSWRAIHSTAAFSPREATMALNWESSSSSESIGLFSLAAAVGEMVSFGEGALVATSGFASALAGFAPALSIDPVEPPLSFPFSSPPPFVGLIFWLATKALFIWLSLSALFLDWTSLSSPPPRLSGGTTGAALAFSGPLETSPGSELSLSATLDATSSKTSPSSSECTFDVTGVDLPLSTVRVSPSPILGGSDLSGSSVVVTNAGTAWASDFCCAGTAAGFAAAPPPATCSLLASLLLSKDLPPPPPRGISAVRGGTPVSFDELIVMSIGATFRSPKGLFGLSPNESERGRSCWTAGGLPARSPAVAAEGWLL